MNQTTPHRTAPPGTRRSRTVRACAIVAASGLFATACGSDDDGDASAESTLAADADDTAADVDAAEPEGTEPEGTEPDADAASGEAESSADSIRLWLNGGDTPDDFVDFAVEEFNKIHPDIEVEFERQVWDGIDERLTTALSSSDSPDVVEFGNTQALGFASAGAVNDLSEFDSDDLLESLRESGTFEGALYGVPYYAGARIVLYRTDLFEDAGIEVPTSLDETVAAGVALEAANDTPNFSGFYLPGKNWYAMLSFLWEYSGDIAVQEGDEWVGQLDSPESIEGLTFFKEIFDEANNAPADGDDATDYIAFCNGEVGMMPAPGWKPGQIINEDDGCPDLEDSIGAFALPGIDSGTTAPVFLGGSVLSVAANSQMPDEAADLVEIMTSPAYQELFAAQGTIPALKSVLSEVSGSDAAVAQAEAAQNSRFVPVSENWSAVEAANILPDLLTRIAQGDDIATSAADADAAIEDILNG